MNFNQMTVKAKLTVAFGVLAALVDTAVRVNHRIEEAADLYASQSARAN